MVGYSPTAQLRPHEHVAGKVMDGELVVINLRTGLYYSSAGIGPIIWQLMESGRTSEAIAGALANHFQMAHDVVVRDVATFLERLVAEDLVGPVDDAVPAEETVPIDGAVAYEAPSLVAFDDMEQAFALDPPLRA